jgi:hypothetical protein
MTSPETATTSSAKVSMATSSLKSLDRRSFNNHQCILILDFFHIKSSQINSNQLRNFAVFDFDFEKLKMGKSNQIICEFGFDLKHKIQYIDYHSTFSKMTKSVFNNSQPHFLSLNQKNSDCEAN